MRGDFSPLARAEVCPAGGVRLDRESSLPSAQFHLAYISKDGMLLPVILLFVLRLLNDERLTGGSKNTRAYNLLGWGTFALVTSAVLMMLGAQLLKLLGVNPFGKFSVSIGF